MRKKKADPKGKRIADRDAYIAELEAEVSRLEASNIDATTWTGLWIAIKTFLGSCNKKVYYLG